MLSHELSLDRKKKGIPRAIEALLAFAGLIALSPLLGFGALLVALSSPGPILYRQVRIGLHGQQFILRKFRSMKVVDSELQITAEGDSRITWAGRLLRKTKIDELPELWNVLVGDMSFVGPRPEVERYVDHSNPLWREVLMIRPGITDPVTLSLRNEEALLAQVDGDKEKFYLEVLQPLKLKGYIEYLHQRGCWTDFKVVLQTILIIIFPGKAPVFDSRIPLAPTNHREEAEARGPER